MTPLETVTQAEEICKVVDAFKGVIKSQEIEIDTNAFGFTCFSTRGFRYAMTEKEYTYQEWTLMVTLQSEGSVKDEEIQIHSTDVNVMNLYNEDGEQALVPSQQKQLETNILKTIIE